jgi:A/G-specific adenine glycosylase
MDPWTVLAAEICLARTRPDLVPRLFEELRRIAPSPMALAAKKDGVETLQKLGLAARARLLVDIAVTLRERHGGIVPEQELALRSLPGVGDNVAQAVLCFGFNRRAVLLDATTARVVRRIYGRNDSRRWQLRLDLYQLAGTPGPDATFNHALLDFGAVVCRADNPTCHECPLRAACASVSLVAPEAPQLSLTTLDECADAA